MAHVVHCSAARYTVNFHTGVQALRSAAVVRLLLHNALRVAGPGTAVRASCAAAS